MPDSGQSQPAQGQIVTFYSFKGGTGRTMALANTAWILAASGKRVLIADWDLESPGLHRFFHPFMAAGVAERPGIIDIIRRYVWEALDSKIDREALFGKIGETEGVTPAITEKVNQYIALISDYVIPLSWQFPGQGVLHFLSPGNQNGDYRSTLATLDWDNFYDNLAGPEFLDAMRVELKRTYDYVLIDSRTGLGDIADICTVHLPDIVIDCFTLASQGIDGAAMIAKRVKAEVQSRLDREITILPVPMRIDHADTIKVDAGLQDAVRLFGELLPGSTDEQRRAYLVNMEVPYRSAYAYEEMLAAFQDMPGSDSGLLPYYERIISRITGGSVSKLPPRDEWLRLRTRLLFSRTQSSSPARMLVDYRPQDQLWAEWIAAVLASAEIAVQLIPEEPADSDGPEAATQTIAVVSDAYLARLSDSRPAVLPDLMISVTDTRLPPELGEVPVIFLAGLTEIQAVERLVDRFGGRRLADPASGPGALHYPGGDNPRVVNIPVRNVNFTGRDDDLKGVREELRARGMAVVLPLTIHGLGGVGKTQLALEYAHRFKTDYDIVWWMNCGQSQYVDASLLDLGVALRETYNLQLPEEGGLTEVTEQVLQLLSTGLTDKSWLLIYDNAEDVEYLKKLLPSGPGHVLITSREEGWKELGMSLKVDVFKREESIRHLRRRMPDIAETDADRLAGVLGDMPLAVAAAGALLASTDMPVADYLEQVEQTPEHTFRTGDPLSDYPTAVAKAWDLSIDQLQRRSAAAARLLEIFSVMAPDISQDLINTQAMADMLRELDPTITERAMIARLIRQIDLLALIKLDNNAQQIQVHRAVQAAVTQRMTEEARATARRSVHQLAVAARPDGDVDDPQTWLRYRLIWPHLSPSGAMWSTRASVRELLIERVRYLRTRDDLERGLRRAKEIETAWKLMLAGTPDPKVPASLRMVQGQLDEQTAESLQQQLFRLQFNLANIQRDLAQFQEARAVDESVLAGQQEHLVPDHPHTLQTRSSLAADLRALGDYQAALVLDLKTHAAWNIEYGDEYRRTLAAAHNLALSHLLTGDFQSALALDRLTLERRSALLGPTHPRTLNSGTSLVRDLLEAGRYSEAVTRMEAVLAQCHETLGDDDRITLNARRLLGVAHRCTGQLKQAIEHIDAARAGLTRGFGADSSDALTCRLSQALNWLAAQRYTEGRLAAEEVLTVYNDRVGPDHPHSLICTLDIATALCLEEDYPSAETRVRAAVEGLKGRLGEAHPYTLAAEMVLASTLASQSTPADASKLTEAEELEEAVVERRRLLLGSQHPDTLRCQINLLLTRHALAGGADQERQGLISDLANRIGQEHPDITTALKSKRLLCVVDPQPF